MIYPSTDTDSRNKELGNLYEAYVGNLFESKGFRVLYTGFIFGKDDHGIDLIAIKDNSIKLIQCKNRKDGITCNMIHQFYGAKTELETKYPFDYHFDGIIYSSTRVLPRERECCCSLNIHLCEIECGWATYKKPATPILSNPNFDIAVKSFIDENYHCVSKELKKNYRYELLEYIKNICLETKSIEEFNRQRLIDLSNQIDKYNRQPREKKIEANDTQNDDKINFGLIAVGIFIGFFLAVLLGPFFK